MNNSAADRRSPLGVFPGQLAPRLYDRVVEVLRARHYSRRTEQAYIHWIRRFILFHACAHPRELAEGDVNRFLTHLAVKENVASSTQNQALAALLFLYEHVLGQPLKRIEGVVRARRPKRLPVVLARDEVGEVLEHLDGVPRLGRQGGDVEAAVRASFTGDPASCLVAVVAAIMYADESSKHCHSLAGPYASGGRTDGWT